MADNIITVYGTGPAGCIAAARLVSLGYHVQMVPAPHPNGASSTRLESVHPKLAQLIDTDLAQRLETIAHSARSHILWRHDDDGIPESSPAWIIDRNEWNTILHDWILPQVELTSQPSPNALWRLDATGKHSPFGPRSQPYLPRLFTLQSTLTRAKVEAGDTFLEAIENGWIWAASHRKEQLYLLLAIDPNQARTAHRTGLSKLLKSAIDNAYLLSHHLKGAHRTEPIVVRDATPYANPDPITHRLIKAGDASYSLDPLSSQGMQSAIVSALQAATVIHTLLQRPADAELAKSFYRNNQSYQITQHQKWTPTFYSEQTTTPTSKFWRQRQHPLPETSPRTSPELFKRSEPEWLETGAIVGDYIENTTALLHPSLNRPVAFLNGEPIREALQTNRPD